MITLRAPDGASPALIHAIDLLNRDLDGLLENLNTKEQFQFWDNLRGYSFAEMKVERKGRGIAELISAEELSNAVREALQILDGKIIRHLEDMGAADRQRYWQMLHDVCQQQTQETKQPKARFGGGGGAA